MQGGPSNPAIRLSRRGGSPFFNESSNTPSFNTMNSTLSVSTEQIHSHSRAHGPPLSPPPQSRHERERRTAALNMEWLKSSVKLLESALRERNKQMDIQRKEIEFLRKELRKKDDVIREYENIIKEREDMEKKELEILHKEIRTLRMDVMSKVMTIREQDNTIVELENKTEKLMSVMPPPSYPRARAQGVSAEPAKRLQNSTTQPVIVEKGERQKIPEKNPCKKQERTNKQIFLCSYVMVSPRKSFPVQERKQKKGM